VHPSLEVGLELSTGGVRALAILEQPGGERLGELLKHVLERLLREGEPHQPPAGARDEQRPDRRVDRRVPDIDEPAAPSHLKGGRGSPARRLLEPIVPSHLLVPSYPLVPSHPRPHALTSCIDRSFLRPS
jgi:hypothetical protein